METNTIIKSSPRKFQNIHPINFFIKDKASNSKTNTIIKSVGKFQNTHPRK